MLIRPAAVAGRFYPADSQELRAEVDALVGAAPRRDETGSAPAAGGAPQPVRVKAIIAPHAAYRYSGPVAASAYHVLGRARGVVERVVLLGPAHRVPLRVIAGSHADTWETPLGPTTVDAESRATLTGEGRILLDDAAHAGEHSLEVHLPFIRVVLGAVAVLPLVVGDVAAAQVADLLDRLWGGPETVIVVSTDLSHYHAHATAQRLDAATAAAICAADPDGVGADRACGVYALRGLLEAARRHRLEICTLDLRTSADTAGDPRSVVGYGAFALG